MGLSRRPREKTRNYDNGGDDLNNPRHANVSGILTGHRP